MRFVALKKAMLDANGITQKKIADKLGISENTMSLKMNGGSEFTRDQMITIQHMLGGVPLDELFAASDPPKPTQ